jgi:hypothetical protein
MRMLLFAATFLLSAAVAQAAQNTGGGGAGGASFSCGEPETPTFCSCTGGIDSRDCKNMKKNCSGDITCPPLLDNCTCKYDAAKASGKLKIQKVPTGTLQMKQNP